MLAQRDPYACLLLDDIGYVQHDRNEMERQFTLLGALRTAQRDHHHEPGLLELDPHLPGPHDRDGGHRPGGPSRGHPRPDGTGEFPRRGSPSRAAADGSTEHRAPAVEDD